MLFVESEESQSSDLNETPVELTPIVMYSLPESSNDDSTPQEDDEFQTVSQLNGGEPDNVAESELKKRPEIDPNVEAENEEPKLGSRENCDWLGDSSNENAVNVVMPMRAVRTQGVCENATKNIEDDTSQEDELFLTASELNGGEPDDVAECELKKCKLFQDKEMMFEVDLSVDSETEEPKSGSQENIERLGDFLNENTENAVMPISAVQPQGVCENVSKNIEDLEKFECEHSGSVNNIANRKRKLAISAEKKEKMPQGVCENATKNIEDLEKFEYEHSGSMNNIANRKRKLAISAEKKEKMPQGVCENATKNIEDLEKFECEDSGSVDNISNGKRKLAICVYEKKEENIGGGSTYVSSSASSGKAISFLDLMHPVSKMLKTKHDDDNEDCDFLETAKKRGMNFARPRWWPPEGLETFDD